jgi:hypothetical protein
MLAGACDERKLKRASDPSGELLDRLTRLGAIDRDREFVAAQARDDRLVPGLGTQASGDRPQDDVAGCMSQHVVDLLEGVEAQHEKRNLARLPLRRGNHAGQARMQRVAMLRGDPATLARLKDKRVIIGATALELGDRFSVPNGGIASGPVLQALAVESILQHRTLHWTSDIVMVLGLCALSFLMLVSWRRFGPGVRVMILIAAGTTVEFTAALVQTTWPLIIDTSLLHIAIVAYLTAIALDEIDFRGVLGRIAPTTQR